VTRPDRGRLLRGGRLAARLVLVWVLVAVALHVLDLTLDDFAMSRWWQPTVFAVLYGLLTAVVWPLVLRVALPVAMFTLGLGSFVLLGAGLLGISFALPGVLIANLRTAVLVVLVVSAVSALVTSALALDEDELFFRRASRRMRGGTGRAGTSRRACCCCRSTGWATTRCAARSATATCRRSRAGWPRGATRSPTGTATGARRPGRACAGCCTGPMRTFSDSVGTRRIATT
jgi:uncharacterized membrane protein YvlD (DUF360 family)